LIEVIGQLEDLVNEEGDKVEQKEIEREIFFSVSVVVSDVVALILKGVEALVFYFPTSPSGPNERSYIFLSHYEIGDPTIFIGSFCRDSKNRDSI
jgi:hypothetical protein